ncbi:MAG TPA: acyltransferase, partial [Acidimicrobiales bacterium]|nr:acyltransferase [Acidimicrobiales bacterium]
ATDRPAPPPSPVDHAVRWGLGRARPGSSIDASWPTSALLAATATWATGLVRGLATLAAVPGSRLRVCEADVTIYGRHWCRFGRWLLLERGVTIRARGGDGVELGDYVVVGTYSTLEVSSGLATNQGSIRVGSRTSFGDYCYVGGAGGVVIGRDVLIGQYVSFHSQNHVFSDTGRSIREQGVTSRGIRVGDDCWIGAGARILDGVEIGAGSVIGAGAVVTKSVSPGSVVTGVPGRVVSRRLADDGGDG